MTREEKAKYRNHINEKLKRLYELERRVHCEIREKKEILIEADKLIDEYLKMLVELEEI